MGRPVIQLAAGQRYGKLCVVRQQGHYGSGKGAPVGWLCLCDCGNTKVAGSSALRRGGITSCGCGSAERSRKRQKSKIHRLFEHTRHCAITRKLSFTLSLAQFAEHTGLPCHYCGCPATLSKIRKLSGLLRSGLDRVNNKIGYVLGNVVSCCATCNRFKGQLSPAEFLAWVHRVYEKTATTDR